MKLKPLAENLTVAKVNSVDDIDLGAQIYFIGKTDEQISLVCRTDDTPENAIAREDGWRGFRIEGILDFSMVGVLAKISGILAENKIGIFVVSTYNTDYVLCKEENFEITLNLLEKNRYEIMG